MVECKYACKKIHDQAQGVEYCYILIALGSLKKVSDRDKPKCEVFINIDYLVLMGN